MPTDMGRMTSHFPLNHASSMKRLRRGKPLAGLVFGIILTVLYLRPVRQTSLSSSQNRWPSRPAGGLPCSRLAGADDTLVVMRTGATEFQDKLPVHLSTTLRCYPNYLIMADFEENYRGEQVVDVLASVDETIKDLHPDFSLYRRLRMHGRAALDPSELSGPGSRVAGNTGKVDNPGWKLDKWKFLPMMNETRHAYPDMRWYLFTETDTYIFWATLLQYLAQLDHSKPYYLGGQINIGDITFAHGGAGFAVSNEGLRRVTDYYAAHKQEWEDFTDHHWAGDCVLGKAFKDAQSPLTYAWPIFQSDDQGVIPYARVDNGHRLWCHPTVSYHHLSRNMIDDMWTFEQEWLRKQDKDSTSILRHKDVFAQYTIPRMRQPKVDWDNECEDEQGTFETEEGCESKCDSMDDCLQYSFHPATNVCKTSSVPKMGQAKPGFHSSWMLKRIEKYAQMIPPCGDEKWLT